MVQKFRATKLENVEKLICQIDDQKLYDIVELSELRKKTTLNMLQEHEESMT